MLVSAVGKFNTFNKNYLKAQNSFGMVKSDSNLANSKQITKKSDFKTTFAR